MKHYLTVALAAFGLMVAAPSAFAVRMRVVDAPPPGSINCAVGSGQIPSTPCSIEDVNATYNMAFVPASVGGCQAASALPGVGADGIAGFSFCIIMVNQTLPQTALTGFNFTFVVPQAVPGVDDYSFVSCDGLPGNVSNTFCPQGPLHAGDTISSSFASALPGVPVGDLAYLFVDFGNNPGDAVVTVSGPTTVPEPGELGLFGLGLLAIGVGYGWEKRRRNRRTYHGV